MNPSHSVITLTFGDSSENHVGMEMLGQRVKEGQGFTIEDLQTVQKRFEASGVETKIYQLNDTPDKPEASVLVIKKGIDFFLEQPSSALFNEQVSLNVDKHAFMYGRVVQKHARWNLCFDNFRQEPDYAQKKGRVIHFEDVPLTRQVWSRFEEFFGSKARDLKGEGNYYYDISKCGIGWHGDSERRKVIALRLGASLPIHYCWFQNGKPISERITVPLDGGDIYLMSEKAVGTDWKKKKIPTLRHSTGCQKFTSL